MKKAVLVMNMPDKCLECPLGEDMSIPIEICVRCRVAKKCVIDTETERRPEWCPLKPLPEKAELTFVDHGQDQIAMGWNSCIDELLTGVVS